MKLTDFEKQAIKNVTTTKHWKIVEDVLKKYLENIKNITQLNDFEKEADKNVVFLARIKAYQTLLDFLSTIGIISQPINNDKDNFE